MEIDTGSSEKTTISVLGGTGKEGRGLAFRWARAGYRVLIGSRSVEKAMRTANEILEMLKGKALVEGMSNLKAAQAADIIVLTVPYVAHRLILESVKGTLEGKILVDVTVPLVPPKVTRVQMPSDGSAAMEARNIVGENVQVTSAFQNIAYDRLMQEEPIECDVLVAGTSKKARRETLKLVAAAGLTGWDAGPLENSVVSEGLTSVLININKQYGTTNAGIKIIGIKKDI
jgi:8-hydroxy-5-deazaflavin:NADPH oxidoreductase